MSIETALSVVFCLQKGSATKFLRFYEEFSKNLLTNHRKCGNRINTKKEARRSSYERKGKLKLRGKFYF